MVKKSGLGSNVPPHPESDSAVEGAGDETIGGLASIAGGWDGSDELVRILEESRRTDARVVDRP
jgi:hypothetical protein